MHRGGQEAVDVAAELWRLKVDAETAQPKQARVLYLTLFLKSSALSFDMRVILRMAWLWTFSFDAGRRTIIGVSSLEATLMVRLVQVGQHQAMQWPM